VGGAGRPDHAILAASVAGWIHDAGSYARPKAARTFRSLPVAVPAG
jgi:hypothetical protein